MRTAVHLAILGLSWALIIAVPVAAEVPDLIESGKPGRAEPMWRSAAVLENEQGIHWHLFNEYERGDLRKELENFEQKLEALEHREQQKVAAPSQRREPPCLVYGPLVNEATTFHSLQENIRRSAAIYSGTVLSSKEGFLYSHPGTLYEVAVKTNLMPTATPSRLFVYYPVSNFKLGEHRICKRGFRYPERPRVGGGILVFSPIPASDSDAVLHIADSGLFFEAEAGGLSVPSELRDLEGIREMPLAEIEEQVREELAELALEPATPRDLQNRAQGERP